MAHRGQWSESSSGSAATCSRPCTLQLVKMQRDRNSGRACRRRQTHHAILRGGVVSWLTPSDTSRRAISVEVSEVALDDGLPSGEKRKSHLLQKEESRER